MLKCLWLLGACLALRLKAYNLIELSASPMMGLLPAIDLNRHADWLAKAIEIPGLPFKDQWLQACPLLSRGQVRQVIISQPSLLSIGCVSRLRHRVPQRIRTRLIVDEEVELVRFNRLGLILPQLLEYTAGHDRRLVSTQPVCRLLADLRIPFHEDGWSSGWHLLDYACLHECYAQERDWNELDYLSNAFKPGKLFRARLLHLWWLAVQAKIRDGPFALSIIHFAHRQVQRFERPQLNTMANKSYALWVEAAVSLILFAPHSWRDAAIANYLLDLPMDTLTVHEQAQIVCLLSVYLTDGAQVALLQCKLWERLQYSLPIRFIIAMAETLLLHLTSPDCAAQLNILIAHLAEHISPAQMVSCSETMSTELIARMPRPWLHSLARLENPPILSHDPLAFLLPHLPLPRDSMIRAQEMRTVVKVRLKSLFKMFFCWVEEEGWFPYPILLGPALQAFWEALCWALHLRLPLGPLRLHPFFIYSIRSEYETHPSLLDAFYQQRVAAAFSQQYNEQAFALFIVREGATRTVEQFPLLWGQLKNRVNGPVSLYAVERVRAELYRWISNQLALRGAAWALCLSQAA